MNAFCRAQRNAANTLPITGVLQSSAGDAHGSFKTTLLSMDKCRMVTRLAGGLEATVIVNRSLSQGLGNLEK